MSTNQGVKTIIYPVKDVAKARQIFNALLGAEPMYEQPYYVGYKVADQDVGLDPNGHSQGITAAVPYWHCDDINERIAALQAAGAEVVRAPTDVGGGRLVANLKDADGNLIGLIQSAW